MSANWRVTSERRLYQWHDRLGARRGGSAEAPRLGKLGDRIGPEKILITA